MQIVIAVSVFFYIGVWPGGALQHEPNFTLAIFIHCLAAFLESLTEPFYYTMLWKGDLNGKVKTELVALTVKSLLTYGLLLRGFDLLAYALAQLAYSLILLVVYPRLVTIEMPLGVVPVKVS